MKNLVISSPPLTYHNFFQIFRLQMMQRFEHILFDIVVQRVLDIGHLSEGFAHFNQTVSYKTKKNKAIKI